MRVPLSSVRGVLWDHDGTLVNSLAVVVAATNEVLAAQGFPVQAPEAVYAAMVLPTIARFQAATGGVSDAQAQVLATAFYQAANRLPHLATAYPGALDTVMALHVRGLRQGMVSNNEGFFIRTVCQRLGFLPYLPLVLGDEDLPAAKPDPRGILQALAGLGLRADECVYVGDSPSDLAAARGAGVPAVGCTWGTKSRQELTGLGFVQLIDHPRELLAHI